MKNARSDTTLLQDENAELRIRLQEAEDTLSATRHGDVDALVLCSDIYTLNSANAATNKLRQDVLTQMGDAVLAFDASDHLIFINPAAERQYGTSAPAVLGRAKTDIFREVWPYDRARATGARALHVAGVFCGNLVHSNALHIMRLPPGPEPQVMARRMQQADLASAVQPAVETSRPLIEAGKHALTVRLPPLQTLVVEGDATRLCQIISNLLNNAAKYTSDGGRIEVSAELQGGFALLSVQDTGVGIPAPMSPLVFDMFSQVDQTSDRAQGGLGIGRRW